MSPALRTTLTLAGIAAVCTTLVAGTFRLTAERIARNEQAFLESQLDPVIGDVRHDGGVLESVTRIASGLPGTEPALMYRVTRDGRTVAFLFQVTAMDGYAGPIRLLVGIRSDGVLTGVRVLDHEETPGLGDRIEHTRSDWILGFAGRSLGDPPAARWSIRADGGDYDQITGASVTSRAVINAVSATLLYFSANRDALLLAPAPETP